VRDRRLLVVVAVAFALRLAWALATTKAPVFIESGDAYSYFFYGRQFAQGGGYLNLDGSGHATAYYPPGYPALLAVPFWVLLHTPLPHTTLALTRAGTILNVVLGTASVALLHLMVRRTIGPRAALAAAVLLALWPNAIYYVATLQLETAFVFLVLATLAVAVTHDWTVGRPPSIRRLVAFGALLAVTCLVRPFAAPFVVVPALATALVARAGWRSTLVALGATVVPFVLLLVPWTVRNERAMGAPLPFSSNTGDTVCLDRSLDAKGGFRFAQHEGCADPDLGEVERNSESTRLAIRFVREHPGREALQIVRRLRLIYGTDNDGLYAVERGTNAPFLPPRLRTTLRRLADGWFFLMLAGAAVGLVRLLRLGGQRRALGFVFVVLPFVTLTAIGALLWGTPRFHLPVLPFLAALAGVAVTRDLRQDGDTAGPVVVSTD
jgi:4-amino-4-deoxy-L-arabinose transferase-like glycosyltransferase